ncbi:MAG: hypothetical protein M3548_17730 [Actinomycetota bacterium]|nr:hypothetical protein [Actinomycetota bacterium]
MRNQRALAGAIALTLAGSAIAAIVLVGPGDAPRTDLAITSPPPPTDTRTPAREPAENPGWQVIKDPEAGVGYEVPREWTLAEDSQTVESSSGVELHHLADFGTYLCQGAEYGRAFSGSGIAVGTDREETASELAAAVAADQYSDGSQTARVTLSRPRPLIRDGVQGTLVRAEAEATAGDPCASTTGTVTVVALSTPAGISVVVVAADTDGGAQPDAQLVGEDTMDLIGDSVRPLR